MIKKTVLLLLAILTINACSSDDSGSGENNSTDGFDRSAMLVNWADNIIIPVYEDLDLKLQTLASEKNAFIAEPSLVNLESLRTAWKQAYLVWQHAEMFDVGLAENLNYKFQMNVYPTNVVDIKQNIDQLNYDLSSVNNNDAVGFPALDYMLYGVGESDQEVVDYYLTSENSENRKTYLSDLVEHMNAITSNVLNDWKNGYRDVFVSNTDNSATGSINLLVNDFIFYYEKGFRANKFGIPGGVFSQNPLPDRAEAYYQNEFSKTLAIEAYNAIEDFFNGKAYVGGNEGLSLDNYLEFLDTIKNQEDLAQSINDQFDASLSKINALNESFAEQVKTDSTAMTETFDTIQLAVVLLKVDMLQALDIRVDYVDADGD